MDTLMHWINPINFVQQIVTVFKRSNPFISLCVMALTGFGLLGVFSSGRHLHPNPYYYFQRQLLYVAIGVCLMMILTLIDFSKFRFKTHLPYSITASLLLAVLIMGQQAWLRLGLFNFQPSELGKLVIILYISYVMAFDRLESMRFWSESVPIMVIAFSLVGFTILQPDFGTALVMMIITVYMLLSTGFPFKHIFLPVVPFVPFSIVIAFKYPYIMTRFTNYLKNISPWSPPSHLSFHDYHMRMAMGNGGLFGQGFGGGLVKRSFLPASHTDSIFAVMVEDGGFITGVIIIMLFIALAWLGEYTARSAKNRFGAFLARGISFYLSMQAVLNIGISLGLLPNTGITLPFLSYGGSSLVTSLAAIGILINVSSQRQIII
ncbi:MAG: FtsW/RodA/SpoVE family cell cycle protein [bacterium]